MVSSMGDMWLNERTAKALAEAMNNNVKYVTLKGNIIAVNSIRGLLTPEAYKLMVSTRKQNWVCKYGHAHSPTDICNCQPALIGDLATPALAERHEPTEAEKLRGRAVLEFMRAYKHDFSKMRDGELREKFVADYILKNSEKTIDKQ
jgi:hypothetical protein